MASYHLSVHPNVSRGKGQSLVRTAAYNGRCRLEDERTGEVWDYRRLGTALAEGIYAPQGAPEWARDLGRLVNEIERFEKRSDAQLAMNLDIALPHEQTLEQNRRLMQDFVREQFQRKGYAAHFAIHPPDRDGDERNIHAHVLVTLRQIGPEGFARSKAEQQERYRNRGAYVEGLRDAWEKLANRHLERNGHDARIDRRSLEDQGIAREPEQHRGPGVTAMERQGDVTRIGDHVRQRQHHYAELKALAAEERQIDAQIIDLQAARAEREAARGPVDIERPAATRDSSLDLTAAPEMDSDIRAEFLAAAQEPAQAAEREAAPLAPDAANSASAARESSPELEPTGIVGNLADGAVKILGKALDVVAGFFEGLFASPAPPPDPEQQRRDVAARQERDAQAREAAGNDERLRATMEQQRRDAWRRHIEELRREPLDRERDGGPDRSRDGGRSR